MHEQVNGRPLTEAEIASILRNWTAGEVSTIAAAIALSMAINFDPPLANKIDPPLLV